MGDDNEDLPNDPAGRLLALLSDVRSQKQDTRVAEAWRSALGLELGAGVDAELLTAYADVLTLPGQIRRETESLDPRHAEVRLKHMGVIEQVLQVQFHAQVKNLQAKLSAESFTALEHLSPLLAERSKTAPLSAENLDDLSDEISALLDHVTSADDVSDDLRLLLMEHLEAMQGAVRRCRVLGADALEGALNQMVGGLYMHQQAGGADAGEKTAGRVRRLLATVTAGLTVFTHGHVAFENVAWPALEAGHQLVDDHFSGDGTVVDAEIVSDAVDSGE